MSAASPRRLPASVALAGAVAAVGIGLPGTLGLVLGRPPRDWPVPFALHLAGDFALRTVVYLSGFLVAFGAIRIVAVLFWSGPEAAVPPPFADSEGAAGDAVERRAAQIDGAASAGTGDPGDAAHAAAGRGGDPGRVKRESGGLAGDSGDAARAGGYSYGNAHRAAREDTDRAGESDHVAIAEPLYGFLPEEVQARLARETGYHSLLYTKASILITAAAGVLLAGSWEPLSALDPVPPAAAARVVAGLYLLAESVQRYLLFARGRPSGTLVGSLLYGAVAPFRRERRS